MKENNDYKNAGLKDVEVLDVRIKCFVCEKEDATYRIGIFPDIADNALCFKLCVCSDCANNTPQGLSQKFLGSRGGDIV